MMQAARHGEAKASKEDGAQEEERKEGKETAVARDTGTKGTKETRGGEEKEEMRGGGLEHTFRPACQQASS